MLMPLEDEFRARDRLQPLVEDAVAEPAPDGNGLARAIAYVVFVPFGLIAGAFGGLVFALFTGLIQLC